jgi:cephalosporin-C deacetylase-like acetyl esterase
MLLLCGTSFAAEPLPNTKPLTIEGDIASLMVDGIDKFLLDQTAKAKQNREKFWKRDYSSPEAYAKSLKPNRERLAHILGVRDERVKFEAPEIISQVGATTNLIATHEKFDVYAIRWPVLKDPSPNNNSVSLTGEGLMLLPANGSPVFGTCIMLPDASVLPEHWAGLVKGTKPEEHFALKQAAAHLRVIIPVTINRDLHPRNGRAVLSNREFLHRSAYELGRHVIGYEIQKIMALVDWLDQSEPGALLKIVGHGEGGMLALYAAAIDERIDLCAIGNYLGERDTLWKEPIYHNVFGLLEQFDDVQIASMIAPRILMAGDQGIAGEEPLGKGSAPGKTPQGFAQPIIGDTLSLLNALAFKKKSLWGIADKEHSRAIKEIYGFDHEYKLPEVVALPDAAARQKRQVDEMDRHNQRLLAESSYTRAAFMKDLKTESLEAFEKSQEKYREIFAKQVIGEFDEPLLPANARTRVKYENDKWTGYEVLLDVFENVIAYGILLVPKDMKPEERRPVVVCQHGLEGRPTDCIEKDHPAYHDFAAKLADRGFVVFAPQNPYVFGDRFRTLQRKANPLGKTLFSVIVPQHEQITRWLKTLPFVAGDRIGFYGLSYGGKSAMRIPALVKNYSLSICSADFNEWVEKNASTRSPYSYVWTGEYEIFEFDLGSTFNYAEMASLIAPRPFMVERGHFDGVGSDEAVAYEFAKVRHLYAAKLGIGDRCEIEYFVGPHTINGKGTFSFLHKHLQWPEPK